MSDCTVYIDESGDLGFKRGTRWFVLSAVVVDKKDESDIRAKLSQIKARLNVNSIHLRDLSDFYRRAVIVREINEEKFTYINIIADTNKLDYKKIGTAATAYNYICRILIERTSWFLRDTKRTGDIVLSARGTSRDKDLIDYIQQKLIPFDDNEIYSDAFEKVCAKSAGSWDLLQLADICATTMFLAYEKNTWGFRTPCYSKTLQPHLYRHNGRVSSYGIKYFQKEMQPGPDELKEGWPCPQK